MGMVSASGASSAWRQERAERRGRVQPEERCDLHGLSLEEAQRVTARFLDSAWRRGARSVLVITGKGERISGGGILRRALPEWIAGQSCVLRVRAAHGRHGGEGALYVFLKKRGAA